MFGWKEIFMSTDKKEFEQAKQRLEEHHIPYKEKGKDDNLRLSINNLDGGQGAALSRYGSVLNACYYLYVKNGNEDILKMPK
ncbi:protein of unknown function [Ruminococcaceae bacterium BL-6]|nr:protein of unknown function [Ruminococcaceae bacterium BL-6]